MTDLTFPPSARRFASFLDREYCVWMPSPSLALLSALVTGKGRPKRLLVSENAPAFISKIGLITGAAPVTVEPNTIDAVLGDLLKDGGMSPGLVWGIATHREGKLSPTDWLARCAASGVPTIELCLGSMHALARWGSSPAMFTVVDLDAEGAFAGARLTALLTSDQARAARVQKLCLPGPGAQDYVFDAWPRGLAHDETELANLVERATAKGGDQIIPSVAGDPGAQWKGPAAVAEERWRALQSQFDEQRSLAEEWQRRFRGAESEVVSRARRDSALLSKAQETLGERQQTIDQWEARFREAESNAEKNVAALTGSLADLVTQKNEFERGLASIRAQKAESEQSLASIQAERLNLTTKLKDLDAELGEALAEAAQRSVEQRAALDKQSQRVAQLEKEVATQAAREAAHVREQESARTDGSDRIAALEAERESLVQRLSVIGTDRDRAATEAARQEEAHRSEIAEHESRAERLETEIAILKGVAAEAARGEEAQRSEIAEHRSRAARLGTEAAALKEREARSTEEWESVRTGLSEKIRRLEVGARTAQKALAELLGEKAGAERALAQAGAEAGMASERLAEAERAHAQDRADATRGQEVLRAALHERVTRLESDAALAEKARGDLLAQKEESERARALLQSERDAFSRKFAEMEDRALFEASRTAASAPDAGRAQAWEPERVVMSERIAHLETTAVETETAHRAMVDRMAAEAERAVAASRAEGEAAARRLADVGRERDGLRAAAAAAEKARMDLAGAKAEGDWALSSMRAENEAMTRKLLGMEKDQAAAQAQKNDADRALESLQAEREGLAARLTERERDRDTVKAEMAQREEAHRAELIEQRELLGRLRGEAAVVAQRDGRQAEAWESERVDLVARIARLEAAGVIADKARSELLNRKKDSDRALAEAESERARLLKKLATAEHERDEAQARAARPAAVPDGAAPVPAARVDAREEGGAARNTGGLSSLVSLWNTAMTMRPLRRKEMAEQPPEPPEVFGLEVLKDEATPSVDPAPGERIKPAVAQASPDAAAERNTGGLSSLVSLWNTAKTMRPFRRKAAEQEPPGQPADRILGLEEIKEQATSPNDLAVFEPGKGPREPDRPTPGPPARPNSSRRPEPKPVPAPGGTEEPVGWLRSLGNRMRPKK